MDSLSKLGKAIIGGFVADASALPLHWHYEVKQLKEIVEKEGKLATPEFFQPMATKFYSAKDFPGHYNLGQLSCYGEQGVMTLEYFEGTSGKYTGGEEFAKFIYKWFKAYTGRRDGPTKLFFKNAEPLLKANKPLFPEAGADDKQTMHTFKIPAIALCLVKGDESAYLQACEEMTRAHQNTDMCAKFGRAYGLILKKMINGQKLQDILSEMINSTDTDEEVKQSVKFVFERQAKANLDASGWDENPYEFSVELSRWLYEKYGGNKAFKDKTGLTCNFPGSFMASLKVVLDTLKSFPDESDFKTKGFEFGCRRNILFGGDNCGRTFVVGPLLVLMGAEVPQTWLNQMNQSELSRYIGLIDKVEKLSSNL